MKMLFQNLITNAIKFQKEGNIPEVKIYSRGNEQFNVFHVQDNGIGIRSEYKDKIFEVFQRLHTRQEYEGNGIGLAHCKKIVEFHRGTIHLESEFGKGSPRGRANSPPVPFNSYQRLLIMTHNPKKNRHPRASGGPACMNTFRWMPASAGMTAFVADESFPGAAGITFFL
jgi:hypothetical protein